MHSEAECAARMQLLTELEEAMGRVLSGRRNLLARDSIMKIFDSKRSECGMDSAEKDTEEAEAATSTFQVKCKGINNRNELEECLMEQRRLNRQRLQKTNSY